jgi:hypothetical protein
MSELEEALEYLRALPRSARRSAYGNTIALSPST